MIRCPFCHQDNPAESLECTHCAQTLPVLKSSALSTPSLEKQIRMLLGEGNKIEAIKLFREQTGTGLKDAKDAVEAIEQSAHRTSRTA